MKGEQEDVRSGLIYTGKAKKIAHSTEDEYVIKSVCGDYQATMLNGGKETIEGEVCSTIDFVSYF